jgi:hypothetical protein
MLMNQKRCKKCGCWISESWIGKVNRYSSGTVITETTRLCKAHKLEQLFEDDKEELEFYLQLTKEGDSE